MSVNLPLLGMLLSTSSYVSYDDIASIITSVIAQFSVANIVAFIAAMVSATVGFVFLWWGVRKAYRAIVKAATKGKAGV